MCSVCAIEIELPGTPRTFGNSNEPEDGLSLDGASLRREAPGLF
jgi:hypothetical protein